MTKQTKQIPAFRFPEFERDGDWVEKRLGEVYRFLVTNSFSRAKLNYEDGEAKNIHYGDIHTKFSTLFDITKEDVPFIDPDVSIQKIREECYCMEGDIIFADASEDMNDVGKSIEIINLNNEKLVSGLHTLMARQIEKKLVIGFGGYLFKSDYVRSQIQREAQGAKVLGISAGRISNIKISFPRAHQEQQKIAGCLSSLDALIAAHTDKLNAIKAHKKGLLQKLFPQEGERLPQVRFPEFEGEGDWVEKEFQKLCEVNPKVGGLPDEFVYVDLESVSNGMLLKKNVIERNGAPSRAKRLLKEKDVIYQMVRPYQKNNYYFIESDNYEYVASTGYAQLRAFGSSMFLFQLIHTDRFVSDVLLNCTGSNYPAINSSSLKQIRVQIPPNPQEQQKIATSLSAADELITAQQEKIEELQQHKKGLMQGLFPKIEN